VVDVEQPIRPDSKAAEEMYRVMFMFTIFIVVFFNRSWAVSVALAPASDIVIA